MFAIHIWGLNYLVPDLGACCEGHKGRQSHCYCFPTAINGQKSCCSNGSMTAAGFLIDHIPWEYLAQEEWGLNSGFSRWVLRFFPN